jgi:hypothetical protein
MWRLQLFRIYLKITLSKFLEIKPIYKVFKSISIAKEIRIQVHGWLDCKLIWSLDILIIITNDTFQWLFNSPVIFQILTNKIADIYFHSLARANSSKYSTSENVTVYSTSGCSEYFSLSPPATEKTDAIPTLVTSMYFPARFFADLRTSFWNILF